MMADALTKVVLLHSHPEACLANYDAKAIVVGDDIQVIGGEHQGEPQKLLKENKSEKVSLNNPFDANLPCDLAYSY